MKINLRKALAEYFRRKSKWREQKAREFPLDERNKSCSDGLEVMALHVSGKPDDCPILARFAKLEGCIPAEGIFDPPNDSLCEHKVPMFGDSMVSQFGFYSDGLSADDCDDFLVRLAQAFEEDCASYQEYLEKYCS